LRNWESINHQTQFIAMADQSNSTDIQAGQSGHIYVEKTAKYNGTWYRGTVVPIDDLMKVAPLLRNGSARLATQEEIDNYNTEQEEAKRSIFESPENMRILNMRNSPEEMEAAKQEAERQKAARETAVDDEGNPIPNSQITDETKVRDEEGNTATATVPQGSDAMNENAANADATGTPSAPAAAATPNTGAKKTKGGGI
jgi:hypothetical protein